MIGQVAKNQKKVSLSSVSASNIKVYSGLLNADTFNIDILPMTHNNRTIGVVEFAKINSFTEQQQQFLDEVLKTIVITIQSVKMQNKTIMLLHQTQEQAEELQAREKELNEKNQKLIEQKEILVQAKEEQEIQQHELHQSNLKLKSQTVILEEEKNRAEKAVKELELKTKQLELANIYKSDFLANMSHELRTPLNSILILSQLLRENKSGNLETNEIKFADVIYSSGKGLLDLINDILDLSKIEAGKVNLHIESFELHALKNEVMALFNPVAKQKEILFEIKESGDDLPNMLTSDKKRISQILKNLLSNAFKFTKEKGQVSLLISGIKEGEKVKNLAVKNASKFIAFSVRDTGIGIPKEKQKIIFEAFQQADTSTSRSYGGTGLGLSIWVELAKVLGGEIRLESEEKQGSTFTVILPVSFDKKEEQPRPQQKAATKMSNDKKVLIIDKEEIIPQRLAEKFLKENTIILKTPSPKEALDIINKNEIKCIVSELVFDEGLPPDFFEKIKREKNTPIIIHTKHPVNREEEFNLKGFADAVILKTKASGERLENEIKASINQKITPTEIKEQSETLLRGKTVLIVDDSPKNVISLSNLLEQYSIQVITAFNGKEALDKLKDQKQVDLVLMDIMMPEMDGYESIMKIRKTENLKKIPIIVLTAKSMKGEKEKCIKMGASDYMSKPIDSDKLISLIKIWLYN